MKILFLSELFYPHGSGAELATYLYAKSLSETGLDIVVITNRFPGESELSKEGNLTVYRLPLFSKVDSVKYSMLHRFGVLLSSSIRKPMKWADVVYIPRFWYAAIPMAKAFKKRVITHLHDYVPVCPLSSLYEADKHNASCDHQSLLCPPRCIYTYETDQSRNFKETMTSVILNATLGPNLGRFVTLSDAIVCVSEAQKQLIAARAPSLDAKMRVVYNPLPEVAFTKIEGDDFGYFGGPSCLKGFHVLCNALGRTKNEKIKVHATKFSETTKSHLGSTSERLILYGKLNGSLFEKVWNQIRAVVIPSVWHEPLPYIVSEAILRGRIVVASKAGGIPELVEGGRGNMLCEIGNYEQLAEALDYTRSLERKDIAELTTRNRAEFLRRFDNNTTIKKFIDICGNLD